MAPRASVPPLWFCLLAPPLAVAACILLLGVNVYVQDEWDAIAGMLLTVQEKGLHLALLWTPHNEHRLPLPRLLFAILDGHRPQLILGMLLSLSVMGGTFAILYRQLLRPAIRSTALSPALLAALFSAMFFSFGQKENLFWNFQLAWSIAICGLVLAALGLHTGRTAWFLGGLALCYLCSAHWVALLPLVLIDGTYRSWQARRTAALVSTVLAFAARLALLVLLFKVYVRGGSASPLAPFLEYATRHPLLVAEYYLVLLGNVHYWQGASPTEPLALLGGALFLALSALLFIRGSLRPRDAAFYLIVATLVLTAIVCIGRSPLGVAQALDSRYQACTLFGWFAILCTLLRTRGQRRWARYLVLGSLVNVLLGSISGLRIYAALDVPARKRALACQELLLKNGQTLARPECAEIVYPNPARQESLTRALHQHDLL